MCTLQRMQPILHSLLIIGSVLATFIANCYGLKLPKCSFQLKMHYFIALFIIIFGKLSFCTRWWRQSSAKNNHIRDSTVVCSVMHSTVQVLTEDCCSQFRDFSSLQGKVYTSLLFFTQHFHSDTLLSQLQYFTAKIKHKVRCTLYIISPMSLQHNTSYTMFHWTFLEVSLNGLLMFVQSITQTTGKLSVFWMYRMMLSQFACCIETLWTFTANIRLHSFMSLNVYF